MTIVEDIDGQKYELTKTRLREVGFHPYRWVSLVALKKGLKVNPGDGFVSGWKKFYANAGREYWSVDLFYGCLNIGCRRFNKATTKKILAAVRKARHH